MNFSGFTCRKIKPETVQEGSKEEEEEAAQGGGGATLLPPLSDAVLWGEGWDVAVASSCGPLTRLMPL